MSLKYFYEIEEQRLLDEAKKVSLFTNHPSTLGQYREDLLRDYLKKFTPDFYTVKSGFIADTQGTSNDQLFNDQTRQIDFLVYNKNNDVPFFETENFAIVRPNSTFAAIEIKSNLTLYKKSLKRDDGSINEDAEGYFGKDFIYEGTLIDAMKNILSISKIAHKYNQNLFTGIFAYEANFAPMKIFNALDFQEIQYQLGITKIHELPFCICVPRNFFVMIGLQDMFDPDGEAAFGQGYFNLVRAISGNTIMPLQFFTNTYYQNVQFALNSKKSEGGGIFGVSLGETKIFSKYFDLS